MAKKRRSYQINSGDYNIAGGGGGAASGNVRFMQKDTTAVEGGGNGILYTPGTKNIARPLKFIVEAGLQVTNQLRTDSTVYFEHAFENTSVSASLVTDADELPTGYTSTLPNNMSIDVDTDSGDSDTGYVRIAQTTINSAATAGKYKFRYKVDQGGWGSNYVDYEVEVWPQNTTPTQGNVAIQINKIIQNTVAPQYLTDVITGSQIVSYTLKNVSGFYTGVTPQVDQTNGKVYVENVGATGSVAAATHSFTVEVDLGQYGKIDYTYSGSISYGDPYGARYFGPANADRNLTGNQNYTLADSNTVCTPQKSSGALRRVYNIQQDTSPYLHNDQYGCEAASPMIDYVNSTYQNQMGTYSKYGFMGHSPRSSMFWASSSDHQVARFKWQVPSGVTSVCMVACGAGSGGAYNWSADGGAGGGLAWINGVSTTAGETFTIGVGLGGYSHSSHGSYGAGPSYVIRDSNNTCIVFGGGAGYNFQNNNPNNQSSSYFGGQSITGLTYWTRPSYNFNNSRDGGGWGANANEGTTVNGFHYGGGCGPYTQDRFGSGAGGYRGNRSSQGSNDSGYYGGGGSGYNYSSTWGYGAGGGVGLDGQGWRGQQADTNPRSNDQAGSGYGGYSGNQNSYSGPASVNYRGGGGGGSGGSRGVYGENPFTGREEGNQGNQSRCGGMHGGGGGGSGTSAGGGHGAPGGVRIIWGVGEDGTARSFPYTYCSEKPSMKYNGES